MPLYVHVHSLTRTEGLPARTIDSSGEGRSCTRYPSTTQRPLVTRLPRHGGLLLPLHPVLLRPRFPSLRAAKEGLTVQMDRRPTKILRGPQKGPSVRSSTSPSDGRPPLSSILRCF